MAFSEDVAVVANRWLAAKNACEDSFARLESWRLAHEQNCVNEDLLKISLAEELGVDGVQVRTKYIYINGVTINVSMESPTASVICQIVVVETLWQF